jgi:hypothetical protein
MGMSVRALWAFSGYTTFPAIDSTPAQCRNKFFRDNHGSCGNTRRIRRPGDAGTGRGGDTETRGHGDTETPRQILSASVFIVPPSAPLCISPSLLAVWQSKYIRGMMFALV